MSLITTRPFSQIMEVRSKHNVLPRVKHGGVHGDTIAETELRMRKRWNYTLLMHDFCSDIAYVSLLLYTRWMELHIKEKVRARRRLQHPCVGTPFETCETRVASSGVFSTIKKIKSFLLAGEDKTVHYHRGQCYPRGRAGGNYLQQRLSFTIYCRRLRGRRRPATVTRLKGELWVEICRLCHSHCLFCLRPSVGFPSITVWPFDVTEVIVDYSLLSASIFIRASHGTRRRERGRESTDCHLLLH